MKSGQNMRNDKILKLFLSRVKKEFRVHLKKIILFGSRARREEAPESDYDILFIFDRVDRKMRDFIENLASEILYEHGKLISTFILTEDQLHKMKFEPFIMNAQKEGMLL